jgi:hypothetical protein
VKVEFFISKAFLYNLNFEELPQELHIPLFNGMLGEYQRSKSGKIKFIGNGRKEGTGNINTVCVINSVC